MVYCMLCKHHTQLRYAIIELSLNGRMVKNTSDYCLPLVCAIQEYKGVVM